MPRLAVSLNTGCVIQSYATILVLLSTLILLPKSGHAQGLDVRPGVRAGLTVTTQVGENAPSNLGWRAGGSIGVLTEVGLSNAIALQPELAYVRKGAAGTDSGIRLERRLDYIQLPLLAKYRFVRSSSLTPEVFAGPFVAFNVEAQETREANGRSTTYAPANIRTTEVGLAAGAGTQWRTSIGELRLTARYVIGLNSTEERTGNAIRNQGVLISVGYLF